VSVATTPYELTTGLSEVASIPANTGMLFDLGTDQQYIEINMSRMQFFLDIIFINGTYGVVGVLHNAKPKLPVYFENTELPGARFFLEVNAGEAEGIEVGDDVVILGDVTVNQLSLNSLISLTVILLVMTMFVRMTSNVLETPGGGGILGQGTRGLRSSHHNNPNVKRYHGPYLTNWQYGGYSYVEEDPTKPPQLWTRAMADYANPDEVIAIAEREGIQQISLAGGFWQRISYTGWGEKVSVGEAKRALAKAKAYALGSHSGVPHTQNIEVNLKKRLEKEAWEEGLAYDKYTRWAEEARRIGKHDVAQTLQKIAQDEYRHREELERIIRTL
jgi:uncharacterized membrane protein (UPF0127 family)